MKCLSILLASLVCLQAWGDGLENQNAAPEAMAMETSVCSMKDGKTYEDFEKVIEKFKKWAAESNYNTYFVSNTPLQAQTTASNTVSPYGLGNNVNKLSSNSANTSEANTIEHQTNLIAGLSKDIKINIKDPPDEWDADNQCCWR